MAITGMVGFSFLLFLLGVAPSFQTTCEEINQYICYAPAENDPYPAYCQDVGCFDSEGGSFCGLGASEDRGVRFMVETVCYVQTQSPTKEECLRLLPRVYCVLFFPPCEVVDGKIHNVPFVPLCWADCVRGLHEVVGYDLASATSECNSLMIDLKVVANESCHEVPSFGDDYCAGESEIVPSTEEPFSSLSEEAPSSSYVQPSSAPKISASWVSKFAVVGALAIFASRA